MNAWFDNTMNMAFLLSEDALAPELRNPRCSGIRAEGWLTRLFRSRH